MKMSRYFETVVCGTRALCRVELSRTACQPTPDGVSSGNVASDQGNIVGVITGRQIAASPARTADALEMRP